MDKHLKTFLIIAIALLAITISYPIAVNSYFKHWGDSGTFGDTFGALNALFSGLAFTGVIITILIQKNELGLQRDELKLQRAEMAETRREFLLNRTTNIVYQQLERFERALAEFTITMPNGIKYSGDNALFELDELRKKHPTYDNTLSDIENLEKKKIALCEMAKVHNMNEKSIEKLAHSLYNSVNALQGLFYKSSLDPELINDLKNTFIDNIGFINMGVIKNICYVQNEQIKVFKTADYVRFNLDVGKMMHTNIFIEPIVEFYDKKIDKENFETISKKWLKEQGDNY